MACHREVVHPPRFHACFPAQGLTITPTFDSSITGDPNAATIIATINSVIALYEATFSDPVTVTITFQETGSGLGASSSFFVSRTYSNFRSHLASDATTFDDSVALAHLPGGTVNPVNGDVDVNLTTAECPGDRVFRESSRRRDRRHHSSEYLHHESRPHVD